MEYWPGRQTLAVVESWPLLGGGRCWEVAVGEVRLYCQTVKGPLCPSYVNLEDEQD